MRAHVHPQAQARSGHRLTAKGIAARQDDGSVVAAQAPCAGARVLVDAARGAIAIVVVFTARDQQNDNYNQSSAGNVLQKAKPAADTEVMNGASPPARAALSKRAQQQETEEAGSHLSD
jgi:hypothetical protein